MGKLWDALPEKITQGLSLHSGIVLYCLSFFFFHDSQNKQALNQAQQQICSEHQRSLLQAGISVTATVLSLWRSFHMIHEMFLAWIQRAEGRRITVQALAVEHLFTGTFF